MTVLNISPVKVEKAADIFSHKLTKASLDAPTQEALAKIDAVTARANYFPYDKSTGPVVTKEMVSMNDVDGTHEFISQTALACEFPKVKP